MSKITYEQAREDHDYLWSIAAAYDMTGGYTDQEDLDRLLKSPSKATARDCYVRQIEYWFQVGPTDEYGDGRAAVPWDDHRVVEISARYYTPFSPVSAEENDDEEY